jgi:hypothetical protein
MPNDIVVKDGRRGGGEKVEKNKILNCSIWTYTYKIKTFVFWCMVTSLDPHLVYIL